LSFKMKNSLIKLNQVLIKCIKLQIKLSKPSHFLILCLFGLSNH